MRTLVLLLILVKSLTGAERVEIEHLAGGNSVFIKDVKESGSTQIYRTVKPSQQGSRLLLTHPMQTTIREVLIRNCRYGIHLSERNPGSGGQAATGIRHGRLHVWYR